MQEPWRHSEAGSEGSLLEFLHVLPDVCLQGAEEVCRALHSMREGLGNCELDCSSGLNPMSWLKLLYSQALYKEVQESTWRRMLA